MKKYKQLFIWTQFINKIKALSTQNKDNEFPPYQMILEENDIF